MQSKPSALDNLFHELARKRLSDWVDFAEARLKGTGVKCYITGEMMITRIRWRRYSARI